MGFLASVPQRALPHDWPVDLWNTARLQVATVFVKPFWLQGAVVYGYATSPKDTCTLLEAISRRIVHQAKGPRFLMGDYNLLIDAIPQKEEWKRAGFQEVQTLAAQRWGILPKATCKNSSRKDFIFVSAELQARLCEVEILDTWFPDHSMVLAKFQGVDSVVPSLLWRKPRPTGLEGCALAFDSPSSHHSDFGSLGGV